MRNQSLLLLTLFFGCGKSASFPYYEAQRRSTELCEVEEIERHLANAAVSETVTVGACRIHGSITVPAGVTLRGAGRTQTTVASFTDQPFVVRLTPGEVPARLVDLSIESTVEAGVIAEGSGIAELQRVAITAERGIGIMMRNLTALSMEEVSVRGPVTKENAMSLTDPTSEETATHGMVIECVDHVELSKVVSSGFARFGALVQGGTTIWQGGGASDNLGTGLMVVSGMVELIDLYLSRTMQGSRLITAYSGVFLGESVHTERLRVIDGEGIGLLHMGNAAIHQDLVARNNGNAAIWVQNAPLFALTGVDTELRSNRLAGVLVADSENVLIQDGRILDTLLSVRVSGELGAVEMGDGVQIIGSTEELVLTDLTLRNNGRVGVVVDLGGAGVRSATVRSVTVDGTGDQLGFVVQQGELPTGWDRGVQRLGVTEANDEAHNGTMAVIEVEEPPATIDPCE